jgi:hypothetical protein
LNSENQKCDSARECGALQSLKTLPFVSEDGDQINFWNYVSSGNWADDCKTGRYFADECVRYMVEQENPALLSKIVEHIKDSRADIAGVETGFFTRIAEHAMG